MQVLSHSIERTISVAFAHRVFFTRAVFSPANPLLAEILATKGSDRRAKTLVVIDQNVARAFPKLPDEITRYFASSSAQLVASPLVVPGGEAVKNNRDLVDQLYREIQRHGIDRHSY